MSNELNIRYSITGLSLSAKVRLNDGTQQGPTIALAETPASSGYYTGDFDFSAFDDGQYSVEFIDGTTLVGTGKVDIKGGVELTPSEQMKRYYGAEVALG